MITGPAIRDSGADDLLLVVRHVLERTPDPEVASSHHHTVGGANDPLNGFDRLLCLDLGHDHRITDSDGLTRAVVLGDGASRLHDGDGPV